MTSNRRSFLAAALAVPVLGRLFKFQTTSLPEPVARAGTLRELLGDDGLLCGRSSADGKVRLWELYRSVKGGPRELVWRAIPQAGGKPPLVLEDRR